MGHTEKFPQIPVKGIPVDLLSMISATKQTSVIRYVPMPKKSRHTHSI